MKYRYSVVTYDPTKEEELDVLAMDIVYYESAYDSLSESWPQFDAWLDEHYSASTVYTLLMGEEKDMEIAREFSYYMAVHHRDEVIESALNAGIVEVVE